jgi:hypothetical protein
MNHKVLGQKAKKQRFPAQRIHPGFRGATRGETAAATVRLPGYRRRWTPPPAISASAASSARRVPGLTADGGASTRPCRVPPGTAVHIGVSSLRLSNAVFNGPFVE